MKVTITIETTPVDCMPTEEYHIVREVDTNPVQIDPEFRNCVEHMRQWLDAGREDWGKK